MIKIDNDDNNNHNYNTDDTAFCVQASQVKLFCSAFLFFKMACAAHCHFCSSDTLLPTGANLWNDPLPLHVSVPE